MALDAVSDVQGDYRLEDECSQVMNAFIFHMTLLSVPGQKRTCDSQSSEPYFGCNVEILSLV